MSYAAGKARSKMEGKQMRSETDMRVLATAWELVALTFRYPDEVLTEALSQGEWQEAAEEILEALGQDVSLDTSEYAGARTDELLHTLRAEATRLFVGTPTPVVSPYEGVWRAAQDDVQRLLFVNPHSMDVERFMRSCGLGRPEGTNEPLDHIATEAEFLSYLAGVASGIIEPVGEISSEELPEGSYQAAYDAFFEEHITTWVPDFVEALEREACIGFYRLASGYMADLIASHG